MNRVVSSMQKKINAGWQHAKTHFQNHKKGYVVGASCLITSAIAAPFVGPIGICLSNAVIFMCAGGRSVWVDWKNNGKPPAAIKQSLVADSIACASAVAMVSSFIVLASHIHSMSKASEHNQEIACEEAKKNLGFTYVDAPTSATITGKYDSYDGKVCLLWRYPKDKEIQMTVHPERTQAVSINDLVGNTAKKASKTERNDYSLEHNNNSSCVRLTQKGQEPQTGVMAFIPERGAFFVPVSIKKAPAP